MKVVAKDSGHAEIDSLSKDFIDECRQLLISKKEELLNLSQEMKKEHLARDRGGDEVDQSLEVLAETQFLAGIGRIQRHLLEIENALARISNGAFGVCEETEQPIEHARLRAIPWTRLSIEGAELREELHRRFAR